MSAMMMTPPASMPLALSPSQALRQWGVDRGGMGGWQRDLCWAPQHGKNGSERRSCFKSGERSLRPAGAAAQAWSLALFMHSRRARACSKLVARARGLAQQRALQRPGQKAAPTCSRRSTCSSCRRRHMPLPHSPLKSKSKPSAAQPAAARKLVVVVVADAAQRAALAGEAGGVACIGPRQADARTLAGVQLGCGGWGGMGRVQHGAGQRGTAGLDRHCRLPRQRWAALN